MTRRSAPAASPLFETRFARECGWVLSLRPAPVAPYRRPHKVRKSRRPYAIVGKVGTVAREAAWSFLPYDALLEGMPMYGGAR